MSVLAGNALPVLALDKSEVKAKQGPNQGKRVIDGWKNRGLPWNYHLKTEKM